MIAAERLCKRYDDAFAVRDVSFTVARAEVLALVGDSGSGKTTTLKMINRLIEPTSGTVRIDGREARESPAHELRRSMGYVFQKVGLFPHMTVAENVAVPLTLAGWSAEKARARVTESLQLAELSAAFEKRMPAELSGGEAQRVGVARAIATEPRIMLLDEPFGALDPLTRDRMQQMFTRLRKTLELTAVIVTHDFAEAFVLADRIGVMSRGELVQLGTARELVDSPASDYVRELVDSALRQTRVLSDLVGAPAQKGAP